MTYSTAQTSFLHAEHTGRIGRLLLDRPKARNALDQGMVDGLRLWFGQWRDDPAVEALVIDSQGPAFCAGGDIRAIRAHVVENDPQAVAHFFGQEYGLNLIMAEYPKPVIALVNGLCLGGGMGISVHGQIRVATENATFAMPETAIALFPDVGMSYVLPRLPHHIGFLMGLTGLRLSGADAQRLGLATHFVPSEHLPALREALVQHGAHVVDDFARPAPFSALEKDFEAIEHCFAPPSLTEALQRLKQAQGQTKGAWAQTALGAIEKASPSSLVWTWELLQRHRDLDLATCLRNELALIPHVTQYPDFAEGVRAMVVDKDHMPRWSPARLDDVDISKIKAFFTH